MSETKTDSLTMKKLTPHHSLTPKGGRVASRKRARPSKRIISRCQAAPCEPAVTPKFMRRTRPKGSTLSFQE